MKRIKSDQIEYTISEALFRASVIILAIISLLVSIASILQIGLFANILDNYEVKEICLEGYEEQEQILVYQPTGNPAIDCSKALDKRITKTCKSEPIKVLVPKEKQ